MAITNGDGYIASAKQIIPYAKSAALTTVAATRYTVRQQAGNPGAGTLAFATTPGVVPTDATSGMPVINAFGGGATGYLSRVSFGNSVAGRLELWDVLYGCNVSLTALATTTVTAPASYLGRTPDGTGVGLRIFAEITTTVSATATTIQVTYTRNDGTAARTSVASGSLSGFVAGRWQEIQLAAGDGGVQKIESIIVGGTVATAGAANIIVARPLWSNRVFAANSGGVDGIDRTGLPVVYADSALVLTNIADSTSAGLPDLSIEVCNG